MKNLTPSFSQNCYHLLQQVPEGRVTTYQALAQALGTCAYRAVGTAMNKNPNAPIVPCHRVVNKGGRLGNYALGREEKKALLEKEGIRILDDKILDFPSVFFDSFRTARRDFG